MINYALLMQMLAANPGKYTLRNYAYTLVGDGVGSATTTVTFNLPIDVSAPFVWCKTAYWADLAGALQTDSSRVVPLVSLQIRDSGSDQPFFDQAQPIAQIAGAQGLPQVLEAPYVFNAGSSINSVFTSFVVAANTYTRLRVALIGYRVFEFSGGQPFAAMPVPA